MQLPVDAGLEQQQAALGGRLDDRASRAPAPAPSSRGRATSSIASIAPSPRTSPIAVPALLPARACARGSSRRSRRRARRGPPPRTRRARRAPPPARPGCRRRCRRSPSRPGASMISALAEHARERQPGGDRLRDRDQVGLDAVVLDRRTSGRCGRSRSAPRRRRARSRARRRCRRTPCDELRRRDDEAALALHRLDHDRGDVLGGDLRHERALERRERVGRARARGTRSGTARGRPRARTGRGPPCTGASSRSASARAASGRGSAPSKRDHRRALRVRRART